MTRNAAIAAAILLGALLAAQAAALAPFILVDYVNHLARAAVFAHLDDPILAAVYARKPGLVPYAGMDWITVPLARLFGAEVAGRVFIAVSLATLAGGALALQRAVLGRLRWEALALLLLLFNYSLAWGNLNYLFGMGLALFAAAGWIASAHWPAGLRIAAFSAATAVIYLTHLLAVGLFALLVGGMALGEAWRRRDRASLLAIAVAAAPLALPVVLWLRQPHATRTMAIEYGPPLDHVLAFLSPFSFDVWMGRFTSPSAAVDWAIAAAALAAVVAAILSRRVTIAAPLRAPLLLGLLLAVLLPKTLWGIWGLHLRLPLLLAVVAVAGLSVRWPSPRWAYGAAAVVLALYGARLATVTPQMQACQAPIAALRDALRSLPRGATLLTVLDDSRGMDNGLCKPWQGFSHLAAVAAIDRQAVVPILFSENTALAFRPPWRISGDAKTLSPAALAAAATRPPAENPTADSYADGWPERYDHVLWLHFGAPVEPPPDRLAPLRQGGYFALFRVRP